MDNSIGIPHTELHDEIDWENYVKETLEKEVVIFWQKAAKAFHYENLPKPAVQWARKVSRAGRANFSDWKNLTGYSIELNLDLAVESPENFKEFCEQVIPHEICHIIAILFWGVPAEANSNGKIEYHFHGIQWQATMLKMGKNPDRTHNMNVANIVGKNFVYKCRDCGKEFRVSDLVHNRIKNGQSRFCGICKSKFPVVFIKDLTPKSVIKGLV